jgi:rhamnulose-1-phosphate aldolase/alcohol dehydrogenase
MSTVESVDDLWPAEGPPDGVLDQLVFASHLLGANRAVSNFGGGNTSAKDVAADHTGREIAVMWVKGSGSDLATMGPEHFTGLKLDEVLPLIEREEMSDEDMVAYLARCQLDPRMPRSSIETLLHAFIPAPHVHHTHPDGINVLAGTRDGERLVHECFGDAAAWIPYIRPGFTLSKQVGVAVRESPALRVVVLAKHGLIVWGDSAEEAYRRTIEAINQAVAFANERIGVSARFGGGGARRGGSVHELLPVIRGAVSSETAKVMTVDTSERVLEFVSSAEAAALVKVGAPCPDHLVHTKRLPLWIPYGQRDRIPELAAAYRDAYREYAGPGAHDPDARVILVEGLGMVTAGTTTKASKLARDLYHRAIEVMAGAQALGEFVSLDADESHAIEYWPLELYKLAQAPPSGELQGKVALVTGAAGDIGRAIVDALAEAGACVGAFDLNGHGARDAVSSLGDRGLAIRGDITSEEEVSRGFRAVISAYGGVDIVVSNPGIASNAPIEETTPADRHLLVAREAFRVMRAQAVGGSIVFVVSNNVVMPVHDAAGYASARAAELHLDRSLAGHGGPMGVRLNTVNADTVSELVEVDEHDGKRARLGLSISPDDVAQAVLHFASERRSGSSTGNMLSVERRVSAAYAR